MSVRMCNWFNNLLIYIKYLQTLFNSYIIIWTKSMHRSVASELQWVFIKTDCGIYWVDKMHSARITNKSNGTRHIPHTHMDRRHTSECVLDSSIDCMQTNLLTNIINDFCKSNAFQLHKNLFKIKRKNINVIIL